MLPRPSTKTGARPKKAVELSVPGWFTSTDPSRGVLVAVLIVLEPGHHRGDQPRAEIHAIEQHDINVDDEEAEEHPGRHVVPGRGPRTHGDGFPSRAQIDRKSTR